MSNKYLHDNFYLQSDLAVELYHHKVKELPLIDYHNHLNPEDLSTNRKFNNIADAWVMFDPYKHRAMRICGLPEEEITGNTSDKRKFLNWASVVPKSLGNPLFMWTALELKRIFGIEEFLNEKNAERIWETCNAQLQENGFGAVDILKKFQVETLSTSDDLLDNLELHKETTSRRGINVFPSLRGDSMIAFDLPTFKTWFEKLKNQSSTKIIDLESYKLAITDKLDAFAKAGCRLADHSLDGGFVFSSSTENDASLAFKNWLSGNNLNVDEIIVLKNYLLQFLGKEYAKRNWVLQLHIGAQRFTSSRLRKLAGPAGGYATMGITCDISGLCTFFNNLETQGGLPRIILYTLNPSDNEAFATITGSFTEDSVPAKIQFGPGWWYNDQYEGIRKHLTDLSSFGLISQFIGMTTDSRSVFSFSRHEYFRRILCNLISEWVEAGNLPNDIGMLSELVRDISYYNSKKLIFDRLQS